MNADAPKVAEDAPCAPDYGGLDAAQVAALVRALFHFVKRAVDAENALFRIGCEVHHSYTRIGISDRSNTHV